MTVGSDLGKNEHSYCIEPRLAMSFLELYKTFSIELQDVFGEKLMPALKRIQHICARSTPQPWNSEYISRFTDLLRSVETVCDLSRLLQLTVNSSHLVVETFVHIVQLFSETRIPARIALYVMSENPFIKDPKLLAAAPEFIKQMGIAEADVKEDMREMALPNRERSRGHWLYAPESQYSYSINKNGSISRLRKPARIRYTLPK